jgi:uncharacterized membrane protein YeaQ/YmgE (transglycosylase-associated protein family)
MGVIAWVILGGLAGLIASLILGESEGILTNIVIGILGAFIGGFVFSYFRHAPVTGLNLHSLLVAVVGSLILIFLVRAVRSSRK